MNETKTLSAEETLIETKKSRRELNGKDKRNIILFSTLGLFILGLTGSCLGIGFSLLSKEPEKQSVIFKDGRSGCYDIDGKPLGLSNDCFTFKFADNANCYLIDSIKCPTSTTTVLLSETYQSETDIGRYLVKGIGYSDGENNVFSGNTDELKTIITNTAYLQIGAYALSNLPSLERVTFGNTSNSYKMAVCNNAFENDNALKEVALGNALYDVGDYAFLNCTSLETINLSGNLGKMGSNVFQGCSSLKTIVYKNTKTRWETIEKDDNWLGLATGVKVQCVDAIINID
ncbi:MAG: leucine-rich repeat domain-containing protein [Bacilli bacterium]|nr:leucine-rich repeat domain-containing protein [Bacilli bacterium]